MGTPPPLLPCAEIPHSHPMTACCPWPSATAPVSTSRAISTSSHHLVAAIATFPRCLSEWKCVRLPLTVHSCKPGVDGMLPTDCPHAVGFICAVHGGFQLVCRCFSKQSVKHLEILSIFSKSSNLGKADFQLQKCDVPRKIQTCALSPYSSGLLHEHQSLPKIFKFLMYNLICGVSGGNR